MAETPQIPEAEKIQVSLEEELSAVTLGGFQKTSLNVTYRERRDASHLINGVKSFWSDNDGMVIFQGQEGKRWQVISAGDLDKVKQGKDTVIHAQTPENADLLNRDFIVGWDCLIDGVMVADPACGVIRIITGTDAEFANAAEEEEGISYTDPLSVTSRVIMLLMTVIPNVGSAALFSAMGFGLTVYSLAASMSLIGDFVMMWAIFFACMLYIFDLGRMHWVLQLICVLLETIFLMVGAVLKSRKYPWTPILFTLLLVPVCLGQLRFTACKTTERRKFYGHVSMITGLSAVVVTIWFLSWILMYDRYWDASTKEYLIANTQAVYDNVYAAEELNYTIHCASDVDLAAAGYDNTEAGNITAACSYASTVWWMIFCCPVIICICNVIISAFCFLQVWIEVKGRRAVRILQTVAISLACLFMGMYFANVVTGASLQLSTALMGFYLASICALMVWAYLEIGADGLQVLAGESNLARNLIKIWNSDWARALAVMAVGVLIPIFLLLTMLNQTVRRIRGLSDSKDKFTDQGRKIADHMSEWNWVSILSKSCIWCIGYWVLYVGFTRATYIFLAWLNSTLAAVPLYISCLVCFGVGLIMFLLPPVPGASVYLFIGLVIGAQAMTEGGVGMILGILISTTVGTITKLAGCTGQYFIGYFLGGSVKIQQMIGVNTVPTRALEKIVSKPGFAFGKVMVLVGGPDWPVSVTCGILRVNLLQMLLGTLPIWFCALPICAVGAFMIMMGDPEQGGLYTLLSTVAMGVSGGINGATFLFFWQQWFKVVNKDREELSAFREEHTAVEELTKKEAAYVQALADVSRWNDLPNLNRTLSIVTAAIHILAFGIFYMMTESCFREFTLGQSEIDGNFEDSGLEGNAFNIVRLPLGLGANGLFFTACLLQYVSSVLLANMAKKKLAEHTI